MKIIIIITRHQAECRILKKKKKSKKITRVGDETRGDEINYYYETRLVKKYSHSMPKIQVKNYTQSKYSCPRVI